MRRRSWQIPICLALSAALCPVLAHSQGPAQRILDRTLRGSGAVALLLDAATGRTLAAERPHDAATLRATPGSILKPFFLLAALDGHALRPDTAVFCRRDLHLAGHTLACTHPQTSAAFTASDALAYSCNTYFAELARRLTDAQVAATLHAYGLDAGPQPNRGDPVARQLLVLGVAGIAVTPAQMAHAYARLAAAWPSPMPDAALVHQALRDSVRFGMAHNADVSGLDLAGKTGTADDRGQPSHGWFCGTAQGVILVVYLPRGTGGDAARLAHDFFLASTAAGPR
jgi:cell division protein FtsI/penicillin-binding protein 2